MSGASDRPGAAEGAQHAPTMATSPTTPSAGRLAILSGFAVAASAIPIPFIPERLVATVRGSVVQDVAARHGLSLTRDARDALAHQLREGLRALAAADARLDLPHHVGELPRLRLRRDDAGVRLVVRQRRDLVGELAEVLRAADGVEALDAAQVGRDRDDVDGLAGLRDGLDRLHRRADEALQTVRLLAVDPAPERLPGPALVAVGDEDALQDEGRLVGGDGLGGAPPEGTVLAQAPADAVEVLNDIPSATLPMDIGEASSTELPVSPAERRMATTAIHTSDTGISSFQPSAMNWS